METTIVVWIGGMIVGTFTITSFLRWLAEMGYKSHSIRSGYAITDGKKYIGIASEKVID